MIKLKIDGKEVKVVEGTSVLNAAKQLGVFIPTMCFKEGFHNHPSCMICLVKERQSGKLVASCALPASENMDIISSDQEITDARQKALELLLSDHVGDCDAPCRLACPAYMNIPLMNRLIARGEYEKSIAVVKEEIAIPHILGYICPAPCEKVCRRSTIDNKVHICQLKKFVAAIDLNGNQTYYPKKQITSGKRVAIVGTGPAGLSTAFYLLKAGHACTLFEKREQAGGNLRYQQLYKNLPVDVLDSEIEFLKNYGAEFVMNNEIQNKQKLTNKFDATVIAIGESLSIKLPFEGVQYTDKGIQVNPDTFETNISGLFACGSAVRPNNMAVRSAAQGRSTAHSVDFFLKGENPSKIHRMFNSKFGKLEKEEYIEYLKESSNKEIQKQNYYGIEPYEISQAKKEAERCMHCDCRKSDNCFLRIHSDTYEVDRKKYMFSERNKVSKFFKQDLIVYEPEKCIKCGLCVEITSLRKEEIGFTHVGRGFDVKIKPPFNKFIDEALTLTAKECAESCPTGAISLIN